MTKVETCDFKVETFSMGDVSGSPNAFQCKQFEDWLNKHGRAGYDAILIRTEEYGRAFFVVFRRKMAPGFKVIPC